MFSSGRLAILPLQSSLPTALNSAIRRHKSMISRLTKRTVSLMDALSVEVVVALASMDTEGDIVGRSHYSYN
jgi:hypothetical protein